MPLNAYPKFYMFPVPVPVPVLVFVLVPVPVSVPPLSDRVRLIPLPRLCRLVCISSSPLIPTNLPQRLIVRLSFLRS